MNDEPVHSLSPRHPRGIALISTMFVLFFLMALALSYAFAARLESSLARNYADDMQAQYCAKAGIYRALAEIKEQERRGYFAYPRMDVPEDAELLTRYQEVFQDYPIGEGTYTVKFKDNFGQAGLGPMDENSLININRLAQREDRETLRRLLQVATDDEVIIGKVIDHLIDYVDDNDNKNLDGAEEMEYEELVPRQTIRNGPMRDVNEFLTVLNVLKKNNPDYIDETIWFGEDANENGVLDPNEDDGPETPPVDNQDGILNRGIKDFVTVDSDGTSVNPNTASPEVLQIVMPDQYEQIIQQRQIGHVSGSSQTYRIRSYGRAHGYVHVVEWVVRLGGQGGYPSVIRMRSL
ncbi:hypothetical protein GX586_06490 [bacterium]|nr:hypothetical protein [bacterium]